MTSYHIKVIQHTLGQIGECRRFELPKINQLSQLEKTIVSLFPCYNQVPNFRPESLKITYIDDDGDEILISSDLELKAALNLQQKISMG